MTSFNKNHFRVHFLFTWYSIYIICSTMYIWYAFFCRLKKNIFPSVYLWVSIYFYSTKNNERTGRLNGGKKTGEFFEPSIYSRRRMICTSTYHITCIYYTRTIFWLSSHLTNITLPSSTILPLPVAPCRDRHRVSIPGSSGRHNKVIPGGVLHTPQTKRDPPPFESPRTQSCCCTRWL